jgi:Na+/alanine symporter
LLEFFNELFNTHIIELKIIATELTLFAPIEIKHFIIKYSKSLVPIMTFAFTLQESFIILKAIQNLEMIITSLPRQDVLTVLEPVASDLYHNLNEL